MKTQQWRCDGCGATAAPQADPHNNNPILALPPLGWSELAQFLPGRAGGHKRFDLCDRCTEKALAAVRAAQKGPT